MKTFKVRSTYEVEVVAEDKGQAREIIVNNAEKHSQNFYKNLKVEEKQEEKKEYMIEFNEKIKIKARNKQDARYEFEERMFEATGGCYQKALDNLIDMFKVTEKQEDVLERLQKEVGDTLTWWVEDQTVFFESVETNKQTEAYIDDFEYDFEKALKIIKSELK